MLISEKEAVLWNANGTLKKKAQSRTGKVHRGWVGKGFSLEGALMVYFL